MKLYLLTTTIVATSLFLFILQIQIGFAEINDTQNKNCGINPHAPPCCIEPSDDIFCEDFPELYAANLDGSSEVPPVDTNFQGAANLYYYSNGTSPYDDYLSWEGFSNKRTPAESIQIHKGQPDENGPVIATLNDVITITNEQLDGPLKNNPLSSLKELMDNNTAYMNIKTKQYPEGEIRGQIYNTNGAIIDYGFYNIFSFNLTKSNESLNETNKASITYDFEKNELTFIDDFKKYNKTLSNSELDHLYNLLSESSFFKLPSNFSISTIPTNYSKYNLAVSIAENAIPIASNNVSWIDKQYSPEVPDVLFKITNYIEEISRPTLEIDTDKPLYQPNEIVNIIVKNNGENTLYFIDWALGVKVYDSNGELIQHFTSPATALGQLDPNQNITHGWTIPQNSTTDHYIITVNSMNYERSPNLVATTVIKVESPLPTSSLPTLSTLPPVLSSSSSYFSFEDSISGGIAGITLKKISYDSVTKELKVDCNDIFININDLLDGSSVNNTNNNNIRFSPICGPGNLSIDHVRILNATEEEKLKQEIMETGFFKSPPPSGGDIIFDGYYRYLKITIGDKSRDLFWSNHGNVIIPAPIEKTLQIIRDAASK